MARTLLLLALPGVLVAGCSKAVMTYPFDAGASSTAQQDGIVYALPKRVLRVTVPYTAIIRTRVTNGIPQEPEPDPEAVVEKPIKVETVLLSDTRNQFILSSKDVTDSAFLESGLEFTVGENGVLLAVTADVKDRTLAVGRALFSTAISIAKVAAVAGEVDDKLGARIEELYSAIVATLEDETLTDKTRKEKLGNLKAELDFLLGVVDQRAKTNKETVTKREREVTMVIDPCASECQEQIAARKPISIDPGQLFGADVTTPSVKLVFGCDDAQRENLTKRFAVTQGVKGIVYRTSAPVPIGVRVEGVTVLETVVDLPQFGGFAVAPAGSKGLTKQKSDITFGPSTGTLTKYAIESGSSAEELAKALQESAKELDESIVEILYGRRLEVLKKQIEIKEAEEQLDPSALANLKEKLDELKAVVDTVSSLSMVDILTGQLGTLTSLAEQIKALQDAIDALDLKEVDTSGG